MANVGSVRTRFTGIAVLALTMMLIGADTTPGDAHEGSFAHNWNKHYKRLAKKTFYTKVQSASLFVNVGEQASDSDLLDGLDSTAFAEAVHLHSGDDITTGTVAEARIDAAIARVADVFSTVLAADGTGSGLDADLLDGQNSAAFAEASHDHSGDDITTGTVAEARIDAAIARVADVFSTVLAADGAGSGLDADLLDGQSSAAFAGAVHGHTLDADDRRRTVQWFKEAVDSVGTAPTSERVVFVAPDAITIMDVFIQPSAALTADDLNFATITLSRRNADGAGKAPVASATTQTSGTGNWTAFTSVALGSPSNTTLSDGQMITFEIAKSGLAGVVLPVLVVQIEYTVD